MKNTKDTLPHFRTLKSIFNGLVTFKMCLVGGEIGRMEKERRKNMRELLGEVFGWKGEGKGILVGPKSFLSWPTKIQSPQIGEKIGEKIVQNLFDKNAHSRAHYVCTCLPLSPISLNFFFFN